MHLYVLHEICIDLTAVSQSANASTFTGSAIYPIVMPSIKLDTLQSKPPTQCHVMPCKIHYLGSAKVSKYFHITSGNGETVAYFRGRKLKGTKIALNEKYIGNRRIKSFLTLRNLTRGCNSRIACR